MQHEHIKCRLFKCNIDPELKKNTVMMIEHTQVGNMIKFDLTTLVTSDANITVLENGI